MRREKPQVPVLKELLSDGDTHGEQVTKDSMGYVVGPQQHSQEWLGSGCFCAWGDQESPLVRAPRSLAEQGNQNVLGEWVPAGTPSAKAPGLGMLVHSRDNKESAWPGLESLGRRGLSRQPRAGCHIPSHSHRHGGHSWVFVKHDCTWSF